MGAPPAQALRHSIDFDVRKWRPTSGYENFDFEVPTGAFQDDCYISVMLKERRAAPESRIFSAVPR